ncbi:MAG: glycogen debranching N-terminal domain-containing protein [Acidimicrobiales bacterium]
MDVQVGPDLLTIHLDDQVLVCDLDGSMSRGAGHGFFAADTRFVSGYRLRLGGVAPTLRNSATASAFGARFEFTNPALRSPDGGIEPESLHLRLERSVGHGLHEDYDLVNYGRRAATVTLEVSLECDFADVFEVKAGTVIRRGTIQTEWIERRSRLTSRYVNGSFERALAVAVERAGSLPEYANGGLSFRIELEPGERWHTCLLWVVEGNDLPAERPFRTCHNLRHGDHRMDQAQRTWIEQVATFSTPSLPAQEVIDRAVEDLAGLRLHRHDQLAGGPHPTDTRSASWVPAAGMPWFAALFGRDSLIVSLQTQALAPLFSIGSLIALGALQGDDIDARRDMQPGKIMHELRRGELAHLHLIPHTPYYGTHDATALYVLAAAQSWRWLADPVLIEQLRPHVERALAWIDNYGDRDGDGLQEYQSDAPGGGYYNQGWKDSGDAIVTSTGDIAPLPLALCELQGYVIAAKRAWADVVEEAWGNDAEAARLRREGQHLADLVEDRFWWEEEGTYYLGLDGSKQPIRTVASNAGHLLWSRAVDPDRARRCAGRLMEPDMWSGWGVRTLAASNPAYNPFSYHRGSIWPHDNAIVAAGMRRYGLDEPALRITTGIFDAAVRFRDRRLPELFSGLDRDIDGFPVQYLGANVPQAWASGAVIHLLATLLDFTPDAAHGSLTLNPRLPSWLPELKVTNLEVGSASTDLTVTRSPDGSHGVLSKSRRGHLVTLVHSRPAGAAGDVHLG